MGRWHGLAGDIGQYDVLQTPVCLYNFHGGCANAFFNNGHALWALGGAHLEPHLEPKATRRPTHVLVDDSAQLSWHAVAAGVRSRTPRVRAPMDSTRAFGHPRVSMELAMIPLSWPQAGVLASENIGGQWGSTPHGASRRAHRLRALIDVHGALPALNARLPCPRMRHVHNTDRCVRLSYSCRQHLPRPRPPRLLPPCVGIALAQP